jgi:hypothetical protein
MADALIFVLVIALDLVFFIELRRRRFRRDRAETRLSRSLKRAIDLSL